MYSSRVLAKWKQLMGHNFPAPTAEILSGPGAEREGMSECLQYGFYWYVILATWWKHHSFFGNFKEGKNGSEKCTLIHSLIYLCIDLIYLSRAQKYHILFLISWTTFISRRTKSYAVLKYKCTQTSLSFWTCRHQSEIFVWHEVFYIKITHALWDGDPVTRAISWN